MAAIRVRGESCGEELGAVGEELGSAAGDPGSRVDWFVCEPLWLELGDGELEPRSTNHGLANGC